MNTSRADLGALRADRRNHRITLPDYTRGEEAANTLTHIAGAVFAVAAIPLLIVTAARHGDPWAII